MQKIFEQISLNQQKGITLAHQLKQQITWLIAGGKLKPGESLPSVRQFSKHLSINLHTVRNAYQMLESEGLVETRQGLGTRVLTFDPRRMWRVTQELHTKTVGVILASLSNPFYHALLQGIAETADENQTMMFVCNTQDDPTEAWRYFIQLSARQVDGIIIASHGVVDQLCNDPAPKPEGLAMVPFVTVDWPGCSGPSVELDLGGIGYQAIRHLLDHGHRRIGLITYAAEIANVKPLNEGYHRALQDAGLQRDPNLVARVGGFDLAAGAEGAFKLMNVPNPPTAIFAITDLMATGAMQAIKASGRSVPGDIALVGFNDIPLAGMLSPPLTTATAPAYAMGQEAMKMLNRLIKGERLKQKRVIFPSHLVVRQSCGSHTST